MIPEEKAKHRDRDHSGVFAGLLSEMPSAIGGACFGLCALILAGTENHEAETCATCARLFRARQSMR
jgi:hypothetical protein